jgi:hypothetical protein
MSYHPTQPQDVVGYSFLVSKFFTLESHFEKQPRLPRSLYRERSAISYQLSAISYQLSAISQEPIAEVLLAYSKAQFITVRSIEEQQLADHTNQCIISARIQFICRVYPQFLQPIPSLY